MKFLQASCFETISISWANDEIAQRTPVIQHKSIVRRNYDGI